MYSQSQIKTLALLDKYFSETSESIIKADVQAISELSFAGSTAKDYFLSFHKILHFDEYPILFIGKNDKSETIVGSFICEDEDTNTVKYFHAIINNNLATRFLKRNLPYLEILKAAKSIFIVTKDYNDKILNIEETAFSQIDASILPLPSAYCPVISGEVMAKFNGFEKLSRQVVMPNAVDAQIGLWHTPSV